MKPTNPIENQQLCSAAEQAIRHGAGRLENVPGLIRRIIETKAWTLRRLPGLGIVDADVEKMTFREFITGKPMRGWGADPDKIEAIIREDAEVLAMWREAMKLPRANQHTCNNDNVMAATQGNSRSYTVSRLQRERPDLFDQVARKEKSANAAAIEAGFRKKRSPAEIAIAALKKCTPEEFENVMQWAAAHTPATADR
jgi:hypothetical protein